MRTNPPPPMIPTPASLFDDLRGRRVIVGVPGVGFRTDLRADSAVASGGRTLVPVLTEQDYYRAEIEQVEVFAPLVPIDRVWVEHVPGRAERAASSTGALDAPMPRRAVAITTATATLGARVVHGVPDGFIRDLRAVTDAYNGSRGVTIRVCGEVEWYRWALAGATPSTMEIPAEMLWIE